MEIKRMLINGTPARLPTTIHAKKWDDGLYQHYLEQLTFLAELHTTSKIPTL